MSARRSSSARQTIRFGPLVFFVVVLLSGALAYFFSDFLGYRLGFLGTAVWVFILLLFFFLTVAYNALFILPADIDNWYEEGMRLILQNYFSGGVDEDPNLRHAALPPSMRIMRAGVLDSHVVLALGRGPLFSRAVGPGYVKLERGEYIQQVIDLRTHRRQTQLEAMTRDGIPLSVSIRVDFHVRRLPPEEVPSGVPFPHDEEAIFAICSFSSFGEGENEIPWTERVAPLAAATARTEISNYTLDEAYQNNRETQRLRPLDINRLQYQLKSLLNERLAPHGIELDDLVLFEVNLPEDVLNQRITNWQRKWEKRARVALTQRDSDLANLIQQSQAAADLELVQQIMRNLEQTGWGRQDEWMDMVTLMSMEALEDAATDVSAEVPSQIWDTISALQVMAAQPPLLGTGPDSEPHSTPDYSVDGDETA